MPNNNGPHNYTLGCINEFDKIKSIYMYQGHHKIAYHDINSINTTLWKNIRISIIHRHKSAPRNYVSICEWNLNSVWCCVYFEDTYTHKQTCWTYCLVHAIYSTCMCTCNRAFDNLLNRSSVRISRTHRSSTIQSVSDQIGRSTTINAAHKHIHPKYDGTINRC